MITTNIDISDNTIHKCKKMKKLLLAGIVLFQGMCLFGQEFQVPQNYTLVKVEDYAPYEQDVLNGIKWLSGTPVNKETDKRKEVNAFLMKWMMGSPNVKLEVRQDVVTFISSPDLLMGFLCGWTKYSLETKNYTDKLKGNLAGIENAIDIYQKNKSILPKDKNIEKYIKLQSKGKLEEEIAKILKKNG